MFLSWMRGRSGRGRCEEGVAGVGVLVANKWIGKVLRLVH